MTPLRISQQITFLHADDLKTTRNFYSGLLGLEMVRDQATCQIFKVTPTAFIGFCEHIEPIEQGRKVILTLVCDDVDGWYHALIERGVKIMNEPEANQTFDIYHFFVIDPNGYMIEIQRFDEPIG